MEEETTCVQVSEDGRRECDDVSRTELKRDFQSIANAETEADPDVSPNKKQAKEVSIDDMRSEVTNPNIYPVENASTFQDISSQPTELVDGNQAECGEVTSTCLDNSSTDETLSDGGGDHNSTCPLNDKDTCSDSVTSCVVLEIPKHASSTGIRKITFKFSKKKEDYRPSYGFNEADEASLARVDKYMGESSYGMEYVQSGDVDLCARNMELKMSKKVAPNFYPTNVKKLLSTGILDGARVKYVYNAGAIVLPAIINSGGYLCGCSVCNYSRVLSAYEFEQHAGAKTRHPNNHIFLENGRPIYSVIQEMKTAPLSVLEEVIKHVAGSSVNEESFHLWKASLLQSDVKTDTKKNYNSKLIGGHPTNSRSSSCTGLQPKRNADGCTKRRDNDLHRLLFMPNGLPDGAELAYYVKGQKLLGGFKQGSGIVCACCDREISPSQFEAHAGMAARRQPYRHIYTSNGLTLHDIALSLASGRNVTTGDSDDMCAICGDGGDLILCSGCPRAFHPACLDLQCVPESSWCCLNCRDNAGRDGESSGTARPIMIRLTQFVKAPEFEMGGCVVCRKQDFSAATFDDRTVIICDQCEKEYHVGCLRDSGLSELKELPRDKWFCSDDCNRIYVALQNSVSTGAEIIPASLSEIINRKHEERGLCIDGVMNDIQWRILSGKSRDQEHLFLLSRVAAIFRECFDPIVATSGRDLIPVMVYGRNISGQEFGGMYCVVLIVKSAVVSAGLLRIFGRNVAELPMVATSREHQRKGYFQILFSCIERLLCSLNVEKLVLPAAADAESIWTKKLGFRKISEEQLSKYLREVQLTLFNGTSMLEKKVQLATE